MSISRRLARPLLSSIFIAGGLDAVQHPESKAKAAEAVTVPLSKAVPGLPEDTATLVRINGAVQVGAGVLLATGKFRRLASVALIGSILPTTYAGHRFWEESDQETRRIQQMHFLKNVGLLGGLILAAVDTEGAPSLSWRAKRRARVAGQALGAGRGRAARKARAAATAASFAASAGSSIAAHKGEDFASRVDFAKAQQQLVRAQHQAAKVAKQIDWDKAQKRVVETAKHGADVADTYFHSGTDRAGELAAALSHPGDLVSRAADHLPNR